MNDNVFLTNLREMVDYVPIDNESIGTSSNGDIFSSNIVEGYKTQIETSENNHDPSPTMEYIPVVELCRMKHRYPHLYIQRYPIFFLGKFYWLLNACIYICTYVNLFLLL